MGNKVRQYGKILCLLPVAAAIYYGKRLRDGAPDVVFCLSLLVCVMAGCFAFSGGQPAEFQTGSRAEAPSGSAYSEPLAEAIPEQAGVRDEPLEITLSFAGDCTLGMDESFDYGWTLNAMYEEKGPAYFLQNVRDIFQQDDLTVVNFEGTLTDSEQRADKTWAFKGGAAYAEILTEGAVEAANLANNHSHDYGESSFTDTKEALDAAGVAHFGYEDTTVLDVDGVKVGLSGLYTVYDDESNETQLRENIRALREQGAEVIIACFHWGMENEYTPEPEQQTLAHLAIDEGADLVVGHHPHVLQGIEQYQGKYIVYSLGNFCFGGNGDPADYDTMIFQQTFAVQDGQVRDGGIRIIPCSLSSTSNYNDFCPTPAEGAEKARIIDKINELSASFSFTYQAEDPEKGVEHEHENADLP